MKYLLCLVGLLVLAHAPILPLIRIMGHRVNGKFPLAVCILVAFFKNLLTLIPDLLAPVIVPFALLFTRWDSEKLPRLFMWWDNDASINGDVRKQDSWELEKVPLEVTPEALAMCYWAKGHHPRSFYARWVWLGLRNRASRLSQILGIVPEDAPTQVWSGKTWTVTKIGRHWRYFELLPVGKLTIRMHCGYKIPKIPTEDRAAVVSIGFSLRRT